MFVHPAINRHNHERDRTRQQRGCAMSPNQVREPKQKREFMAGRTGLAPGDPGDKPPES